MFEQFAIGAVILAALVLFVVNVIRYDIVAMLALLAAVLLGLVPAENAFEGFGNPAVITVAAVLVISRALWSAGVVDALGTLLSRVGEGRMAQLVALTGVTAVCSAFISNTGTMAIVIPAALYLARRSGNSPSMLLMPMAFGSLLGGIVTLVGTPPNILIASFRRQLGEGDAFGMFDFSLVGLPLAVAGLVFIWLFGRLLTPNREGQGTREQLYQIEDYLIELRVKDGSNFDGKTFSELRDSIDGEMVFIGLVRDEQHYALPRASRILRQADVLVLEADTDTVQELMDKAGLELASESDNAERFMKSDEAMVTECVVNSGSRLVGRNAAGLDLRRRHGLNLLAVSRQGSRLRSRLKSIRLRVGDILLLQGETNDLENFIERFGCLPLAERSLRIGKPRQIWLALGLFAAAIAVTIMGWLTVPVAFVACVAAMVLARVISPQELYDGIDWPIIVLLGATIPLGGALENSGAAASIAGGLLDAGQGLPAWVALGLLMIVTMGISNVINNAAATVLMVPIAVSLAQGLNAAIDPFLMAVAIAASLPFLTPIGHQSNVLVMGPGGYHFGDYWRLGLPLSLLMIVLSVPLILWAWPV